MRQITCARDTFSFADGSSREVRGTAGGIARPVCIGSSRFGATPMLRRSCAQERGCTVGPSVASARIGCDRVIFRSGSKQYATLHSLWPLEVQWNASGALFQIFLFSAQGEMLGVLANQGAGPGTSYNPTAGTYYLQVNTVAPWSLRIVPAS